MPDTLDEHYGRVVTALMEGRVIPFFGAGVNLCGRRPGEPWRHGCEFLPSGIELAKHLAARFRYPWDDRHDLVRVSQYAAIMEGLGPLYLELRRLFNADYAPTPLHRFFAALPATLREKGLSPGHQFVLTTNYDDLMERAFDEAGESYDLVAYVAEDKQQRGRFLHRPPGGEAIPITRPNKYINLSLSQRSVILKIHGAIDRKNAEQDSFVITEDNYIEYLT
ncbi:MAG TPA: SIR2 family protein, partial [Blastocatellia bacterium]